MSRIMTRAALAALLMCGASVAFVAPATAADDKISAAVGKPLNDAIAALGTKDYKAALAAVQVAQQVPNRTPLEDLKINQILTIIDVNLQDFAGADAASEAAADSPALTDADKKSITHDALLLSAQSKHWQKTVAYGKTLEAINGLDAPTLADLAVAYYNLNDMANAQAYAQKSVDAAKAAGQPPDQAAQEILMNASAKANPAVAEQMLENIVAQGNNPEDWNRLIDYNFGAAGMNDVLAMDLYRLKYLTKSIRGDDATLAGRLGNQLGYFGDAIAIMEAGGVHNADLSNARTNAARDQASLSGQISEAKKSSGQVAVKVAEGLYGYGRFAEAEEIARDAMAKGGMKVPAEAPLLVGMSQVGQGKNADAVATFNAISGSAAVTKTAKLWAIYAQHMAGGTAAAPAPATGTQPQQ